jgi:methionine synthase II (cobalamin-independent)
VAGGIKYLTMAAIINPFSTTGIGSLPHALSDDAVEVSLSSLDIPFWPQLPKRSFKELMVPQYSEGMPSVRLDAERGAAWVERDEEEIARFYESTGEGARVAISEEYAHGLYAFLRAIKGRRFAFLKGHITGPLTFTLGLADREGRPIYYDEELREIALMLLKAKARWQVDVLGHHAEKVIVFIDEPILSALGGTAYMGVTRDETLRLLAEAASAVKGAGGMAAIHCCGRAEWPLLMETGIEILNFDAYEFGDTLGIYPDEVAAFLRGGGYLAWGIVPTTDAIEEADEGSLVSRLRAGLEGLSGRVPRELVYSRALLTPSCGAGSLSIEHALKAFQLLMRVKESFSP